MRRPMLPSPGVTAGLALIALLANGPDGSAQIRSNPGPRVPGHMVDIGGQRIHMLCTGSGSPSVILESGAGDFWLVWSLVQPAVSRFARVCSYDRGGYAWSDPGSRPRTYAQLGLELHAALTKAGIAPPYVLVGQSYGGLLVRAFAERYRSEVVGMVLVDAAHEDQRIVMGGQPVQIRSFAKGRDAPVPHIGVDTEMLESVREQKAEVSKDPLEPPLNRLPVQSQRRWRWAEGQPIAQMAQAAEMDWSPEELVRIHDERLTDRATLGDLPLIVLARTAGGYDSGMSISADSLERERRAQQADLAALSRRGRLLFAPASGHNIHLEDPALVVAAIREIVQTAKAR